MSFRLKSFLAGALGLVVAVAAPAGAQQQARGPVPVTVVTVQASDVALTSLLPGRVVASSVAQVRPQVDGIIKERLFTEGTPVELGDPLYKIDDASYRAQVAQAEAQVAQAEAQLRTAQQDADRNEELLQRNTISQQTRDESLATRDAANAALELAKAQLMAANINLDRTTIRAPLSGVIGLSLTTQGALVSAGQSDALTVIRTLDPVNVDVTQSAAEILRWRRGQRPGSGPDPDPMVSLTLADGSKYGHTGHLSAAEPYVNESTGVVVLRMQFDNPEGLLLPGMYVQVEIPLGTAAGAILTPQEGVSRDSRGQPLAYVVGENDVIETRQLTIEGAQGNQWIVTAGLEPGDRVVVEGVQKIANGATVTPEERAAAPADTDAADATPAKP
ncbi:efflux RND transporter periplasmic adaptor subunit [Amaricoccus solimangrovi]|uniref:Efflux RND transporter periplasmic adaptor subunit n=1 Tax=Amaricoccus solimangrovi TaxID=2589815 RepID=A0A501WWB3_9RHOB|nr:efflux RND transporter periplasmic adaptor subunit [Amaricoccus solimangrovi]TPE52535.1 efflux RND transporter periplasmic adaptor subunit [Amaricoccus solimangrovi]